MYLQYSSKVTSHLLALFLQVDGFTWLCKECREWQFILDLHSIHQNKRLLPLKALALEAGVHWLNSKANNSTATRDKYRLIEYWRFLLSLSTFFCILLQTQYHSRSILSSAMITRIMCSYFIWGVHVIYNYVCYATFASIDQKKSNNYYSQKTTLQKIMYLHIFTTEVQLFVSEISKIRTPACIIMLFLTHEVHMQCMISNMSYKHLCYTVANMKIFAMQGYSLREVK